MEQFKRTQVIILPTENNTNIVTILKDNLHYTTSKNIPGGIYQNLYIISDDEIEEGDWILGDFPDNPICKVESKYGEEFTTVDVKGNKHGLAQYDSKKIIATTDTSLEIVSKGINPVYEKLPQTSQQFIEKYIESYNKGDVITDVLIEYQQIAQYNTGEPCLILKLDKNNTITIKKLKDSWSREEVSKLCAAAWDESLSVNMFNKRNSYTDDFKPVPNFKTWIEENL